MKMRDKVSTVFWLIAFVITIIISFVVSAGKNSKDDIQLIARQTDQYVYDGEGCLSKKTVQTLNYDLKRLEEITGIQYFVVSTTSYGEHVIEDYSYTVYQDLITSKKPTILLLFSYQQKGMILRSEKKWKGKLNPYFVSHITDEIFEPYLMKDKVSDAVLETMKASLLPIAKDFNIPVENIISGEVNEAAYVGFERGMLIRFIEIGAIIICFVGVIVAISIFLISIYYYEKKKKIAELKEQQ